MPSPPAKKLIEVALPLDAINRASAREKSIRHGHPSTLHLWWARRPLAAARAVIFTSLVDDPDDPNADPAFVEACRQLNYGATGDELAAVKRLTEENSRRRENGQSPKTMKRNIPQNVREGKDSPRMRLFDFIERLVEWEATTDEQIMGKARELIQIATKGKPPPLLDPFAGGGSIPLEAQRLGLEAHASDLNPVAVMINKAMIEIPPRFANMPPVNPRDKETGTAGDAGWKGAAGLAADVRYYGEWMREQAFKRIGHLYPKHKGETVIAWLWARTVISPNPAVNAPVPLVRSFVLSKKKGRECWAKPVIVGTTVRFEVTPGKPPADQDGTMGRKFGGGRCVVSGEPMSWEYVRAEGKAGRMGEMLMAIVTEGKRGRNYSSPDPGQVEAAAEAEAMDYFKPSGKMPLKHRNFQPPVYGMYEFGDLFTPRQLTALTTFSDLVQEARELATQDALAAGLASDDVPLREGGRGARAYGEAVSVYLAFAVDKLTPRNSSLTLWDVTKTSIGQVFGRQAIPMVWSYAEVNPIAGAMGSWFSALDRECRVLDKILPGGDGFTGQHDATSVHFQPSVLSTDPPYYDNIGYADLSDFFYVWLRRSLRAVYPELFATMLVPKADELIASTFRHGGKNEARKFFESGMLDSFSNMRQFVIPDYPQTVYYAFKQQDAGYMSASNQRSKKGKQVASTGWETMLTSLIKAGFSIVGTWPMRTEGKSRMNAQGANALASSIVLVCRPRPEDAPATSRRRFLDALRAELPAAIAEMKTGSIAPVDMAQATIGPGMAIYSRYRAVLEADGKPLTVRAALGLINAALDEVLAEQDAELDPETRFAIGWFEQHGFQSGDFGQANVLAQAKNTAVASVALAGVVESGGGQVRLINWREYDPCGYAPEQDKRPTVWEGAHHLIERLNHHGELGAAALYNRLPGEIAESARDLAYRLYHICDRLGWAEDALDYNALVSSWSEITRLAASERGRATQGDLFDEDE